MLLAVIFDFDFQYIDTEVAVGNGGAVSTNEEIRDKSSYKPLT